MNDMDDLNNLMDNFDIHTFWRRKKLLIILGVYLLQSAVVGTFLIKAVLDASDAGAVPKGMEPDFPGNPTVVR